MKRLFLKRLRKDQRGSTIVEFALLAPVIIGMFLGVIQLGISMQAYNSMRGVASDTARYAVVEYMKANTIGNDAIRSYAVNTAKSAPYSMQDTVAVTVTSVATPRVHGTFEKTITIRYTPPDILPLIDFTSKVLTFSRPIFLIDE